MDLACSLSCWQILHEALSALKSPPRECALPNIATTENVQQLAEQSAAARYQDAEMSPACKPSGT